MDGLYILFVALFGVSVNFKVGNKAIKCINQKALMSHVDGGHVGWRPCWMAAMLDSSSLQKKIRVKTLQNSHQPHMNMPAPPNRFFTLPDSLMCVSSREGYFNIYWDV